MKTKILLIGLIIFLVNVISVNAKETIINHPLSEQELNEFVILQIAKQIGIPIEQIIPENVFWDQTIHGDALDIVEVTMSLEERLGIIIDEQEVDRIAGSSGILSALDNPHLLKIVDFQSLIRKIYIRHYETQKKK